MENKSVDSKSNDSVDNEDEIEYEETIDMILLENLYEIKKQIYKEDFLEIWNFLRELDRLDDDKLKKEIQKYLKKKDENEVNKIFGIIRQCEVIKKCEGQKDCKSLANCKSSKYCKFKILHNPFCFDYDSHILLMFCLDVFEKKHNKDQHKKNRMKQAVFRIYTEGGAEKIIWELRKNTNFDLAKEQYHDILIEIHMIGILIGQIRKMNAINSDDLENSINSMLGAKNIAKRWEIRNSIKDIIKQIAVEKYKNGDSDWHNYMAYKLDANFTSLKNGNEHMIKDEIFLKHLPELKELMEAVDSAFKKYKNKSPFKKCKETNKELTLEDYEKIFYNQYIGINMIQDTIKEVAYPYKRVYGVHNSNRSVLPV